MYQTRLHPIQGWLEPEHLGCEVNSSARPNVSRDGLEIFFDSNRPGGAGGYDIWSATRSRLLDPWAAPMNLGPEVNSAAAEHRPTLAADGHRLHFGSTRPGGEGSSDIYVVSRR
jgi:hypothetical protein